MRFFPASPFRLPKRRELIAPITILIKLENQLLSPGENLKASIVCLQEKRPPDRIIIFNHYLKFVYKNQTEVSLKWEKKENAWEAFFEFLPQSVGSYLLKFSNGTRDPINPYTRYFAVIDEKSTVLSFRHHLDMPMANYGNLYHRNFIPADFEMPFNPTFNKIQINPNWMGHRIYRYFQNKYGDNIYPLLSLQTLMQSEFAFKDPNLSKTDELAAVLSRIQDFLENDLHYLRPQIMSFDIFPAHLPSAAIASKILALTGFFPDLQIYDTSLKNNLHGMPLYPYFVNVNELRASDSQKSALVGIPVTSHPLFTREYGAYQLSPAIAQRNGYASGENMGVLFEFLENLIRNRDQRTPNFLTIDFQDNHVPDVVRMNLRIFQRIIKYARRDQLVFAHKLEIAKYFQRKFNVTPEKAFFLQDSFPENQAPATGFTVNLKQKSGTLHDTIYFENSEYRFCFRRNELTPYYFFKYGDLKNLDLNDALPEKNISRQKVVLFRSHETTVRFILKVYAEENDTFFPVALWALPATLDEIQFSLKHNFNQFIAVHDRLQRELHAIAILAVVPGVNEFYLDLGVKPRRESIA
jgi:hypothetical protein